ncbi:MAG: MFS transporter [Bacteriovoracales bacterium]
MKSSETIPQLGGGYAWFVWSLVVFFVVYLFSVQTGYAIINPSLQKDLALTIEQVGITAATYTWAFAFFQFYAGAILDQLGSNKVIPFAMALVTLGVFTFANATSFKTLLLSQILLALGSCFGFIGAGYIGGKWFGLEKFSFMFGLVQMIATFTSAISQNLIGFALKQMDWRSLFIFVGAFGLGLTILGIIYIKNPTPEEDTSSKNPLEFFKIITKNLMDVVKIPHIWVASMIGAGSFGVLLSLGVVYAPKLLIIRGASPDMAVFGSSMIWLGLAAGCLIVPWWSDYIQKRKLPILVGTIIQFIAFTLLLYVPDLGIYFDLFLCLIFGFANANHMLTFSTSSDVVNPHQIGTSAAIVNGIMFIVGGLMIQAPGSRVVTGIEEGLKQGTMEMAAFAGLPLVIVLGVSIILAFILKETYPKRSSGVF